MSYLKHLPVDMVKIDRSFTQDVSTNFHDATIVQGVITMAHHLGLEVVAEGVETRAQQTFLADRGCDLFQGYLFARPMPISDLADYLVARRFA